MDKDVIVDRLDDITTNVAKDLISTFEYKDYIINKNEIGTYSLLRNGEILYADLYLFSVAFSLAKCLDEKNFTEVNELLRLETNYVKHINDMYFYKNSKMWELYDTAKKNAGDYLILIHRFTKQKIQSK